MIGIYLIENLENSKKYVGKTAEGFCERWNVHRYQLRNKTHNNKHLLRSWEKYGEQFFEFSILEECEECLLKEREEYWINKLETYDKNKGYNICIVSNGVNHLSKETKQKISEFRKGKTWEELIGEEKSKYLRKEYSKKFSGENNSSSKLTLEQVEEIRQKYIPRIYSQNKLAKEYNVHEDTIFRIIHNIIWKENKDKEIK